MPEADEVRLTAERLGLALTGSPLIRAELRWPSIASANLLGATVIDSASYGKHLLTRFDDGRTLHTHLRMDGSWRVARTGTAGASGSSHKLRAILATEKWTCLGELLGEIDLIRSSDEPRLLGQLGPQILAEDFTTTGVAEAIRRLMAHPDAFLCQALLDQQIVAGIGTIWMAESLFRVRLWPWTTVAEVTEEQLSALLRIASQLIAESVEQSRRAGMGAVKRYAYGRAGKPCVRCNTRIKIAGQPGPDSKPDAGVGQRIVHWCPECQTVGAVN